MPLPPPSISAMEEYYQLEQTLLLGTLAIAAIIFISVWLFYSLQIAGSYGIGAVVGVVYLRMLTKDVQRLGRERMALNKNRFALLVALFVLASKWQVLEIVPVVLGFLTYKATILVYMLYRILFPASK
ncbi:MAG TPA: ATP synthase subunit I [Cyanobacteria bacterium UBA11149]|nr:ATP synthase subunit I [Cyanobacteria bacterium UBA11366]HBK65625.1 ATP synthase subunit I [Cyanobacteria bacterium UBA11166]HBR73773.1 ATP synthase subunit I [Cyanobacteria bacterium UBA11159]HBS70325.1 ATP synthase subunit I [Cyanobacteria bacterium UBA11153]HBW89309.1 ATP synthase subunit I [Cyanobacteria bacterium UBA11149]HCA98039.1 ATP synthase subunit I [Cyanobacteria bacterium UBA9226]